MRSDLVRANARGASREVVDAVVSVSSGLELTDVLERVVRSACALVGATYGALGVLAPNGSHISHFVTHGVTEEQRRRIGPPPEGRGVLGRIIRDGVIIRRGNVAEDPASVGFPPHHPPMSRFLGVPVRVRGQVYGAIYVADAFDAPEFTAEDESVLGALAAAAGVAIDNARLYEESRRRQRFSAAVSELSQSLLEVGDEDEALRLMVSRSRLLAGAETVVLVLRDEAVEPAVLSDPESMGTLDLEGGAPAWVGTVPASPLLWCSPPRTAEPDAREARRVAGHDEEGPVVVVPVRAGRLAMGTLVVAWAADAGLVDEHVPALAEFAERAAIVLAAARSHRDRERLALLEDRDRIARDMHDNVVQRLFATGLALQSAAPLAEHPVVRARMHHAVDELDAAIKEIREAIFELHAVEPVGLLDEVQAAVEGFADTLGFVPELVVDGRVGRIPPTLRPTLLAVIRESLANVARHARAAHVRVLLLVDDRVTVTVTDDGVGLGEALPQSGLVNLRERAEAAGGRFTLTTTPGEGTTVSWTVPLKGSPA